MQDIGDDGPVEIMLFHRRSNSLARPDWENRMIFPKSWHATLFISTQIPPSNCEWIKVFGTVIPTCTFGDLLRRVNGLIPHLDPAPRKTI